MADGISIRDVRGFPVLGTVEALCEWSPAAGIERDAAGQPVHLGTHITEESGPLILFDGPRGTDVRVSGATRRTVVPLSIPEARGRYRVEFDPVVEGCFWASSRGIAPLVLNVERHVDGSLTCCQAQSSARFRLPASPGALPPPGLLYGYGDSPRCIEIPWVLLRYRGERRVLDVGPSHAEPRHLTARARLGIPFLAGLDLAPAAQPGLCAVVCDVRQSAFQYGSFDLILAISVIEHIGRDVSMYVGGHRQPVVSDGYLDAVRELGNLLAPAGRLLVTVPFGAPEDHGWFIQYDECRLARLVAASGLEVKVAEYYAYADDGWTGPVDPQRLQTTRWNVARGSAGGVACVELYKPRVPLLRTLLHRLCGVKLPQRLHAPD